MRPAPIRWILTVSVALLLASAFAAGEQKPAPDAKTAIAPIPKLWHSEASNKDFRIEMTNDVFRADWVNLPPAAAKAGAYVHTECRRSGAKWVGTSKVHQAVAVSKDPANKGVKMCDLTVRFEVDSITPQRLTFHSEAMRNFDPAKCQILQTAWLEFHWVPKK